MSEMFTGGCMCKAVRYRSKSAPIVTRTCWCRTCQYIAAGNGTVNVVFPSEGFEVEGITADFPSTAASGNEMHRHFCPVCGTHLFGKAPARPHLIVLRAGTLDDPDRVEPALTIWTKAAPRWACINETLPQTEGQPP